MVDMTLQGLRNLSPHLGGKVLTSKAVIALGSPRLFWNCWLMTVTGTEEVVPHGVLPFPREVSGAARRLRRRTEAKGFPERGLSDDDVDERRAGFAFPALIRR